LTSELVGAAFNNEGKKSARVNGTATERIAAVIKNFIVTIDFKLCVYIQARRRSLTPSFDFIYFSFLNYVNIKHISGILKPLVCIYTRKQ